MISAEGSTRHSGGVFRGTWVAPAVSLFVVMVVVQLLVGLLWVRPGWSWWELLVFATVFTTGSILFDRPWLRVSADGVRAGRGPFTRARVPVAEVAGAGPYRLRPRRRGAERQPGDTVVYRGWGPRVMLERVDGSRVVVGVADPAAALAALGDAGVPVRTPASSDTPA